MKGYFHGLEPPDKKFPGLFRGEIPNREFQEIPFKPAFAKVTSIPGGHNKPCIWQNLSCPFYPFAGLYPFVLACYFIKTVKEHDPPSLGKSAFQVIIRDRVVLQTAASLDKIKKSLCLRVF